MNENLVLLNSKIFSRSFCSLSFLIRVNPIMIYISYFFRGVW